jgi:hypothetical protein
LRLRARRARLAERERQEYERERTEGANEPERAEAAAQPGARRISGALGAALAWVASRLLRLAALVERTITVLLRSFGALGRSALALAGRLATPERVLVAVCGAAAGCLVVSQFVAYRGIEVGAAQYEDVSAIAPPEQVHRIDAGAAHAYVLVPLAAIALAVAVVALLTGRWRLGRVVSLIGLAGIAIGLAIDLPKGLDVGSAGIEFAGAKATMTNGFYVQLAASAVLVLCGWALGRDLRRRAGVVGRRRTRRSEPRARRTPSVAGGDA